jgi:folate-binding Fe-S cluster repair protein YgfZ
VCVRQNHTGSFQRPRHARANVTVIGKSSDWDLQGQSTHDRSTASDGCSHPPSQHCSVH